MRSADDDLVVDAFVEPPAVSVMYCCPSTFSSPRHQESQWLAAPEVACGPLSMGEQRSALWTARHVPSARVQHASAWSS
jgi:hypothetical protein